MKTPKFISAKDTIALTSPSFSPTIEPYKTRFNSAQNIFRALGYNLKIGETCYLSDGIGISTNPKTTARELEEMYLDDSISCIWSCGGGELMCETVDNINFKRLKKAKPKWFIGYSDNTNFIFPLVTLLNTKAIYGNCFSAMGKEWEESEKMHLNLLEGKQKEFKGFESFQPDEAKTEKSDPLGKYNLTEKKELKSFVPSKTQKDKMVPAEKDETIKMEGTLLGGCLDVLYMLSGTDLDGTKKFIKHKKGIIWCIEACDLSPIDIRRTMWHLKRCGWFKNVKGFLIGRPLSAWKQECMGVNQYNAITETARFFNVPVICDADFGHIDPMIPLVMGAEAKITVKENQLTICYN